ncbi:C40 family peptidase [Chryseoglobus sp. 28M-23]|nr:C40 family peptidase [Chryseoglobus sp. 28M-23]
MAELRASESQTVSISATAEVAQDLSRDEFDATSVAELRRAQLAAAAPKWSGPTVGDFLANPPYPNFSLDQVVQVGLQYQGVPYRWGGSTPAGFDCSGFVQYVYAQFGIALPHSVRGQAAMGTPISRADARAGDIVIFNDMSHNGIYMGGGQILDAPYAGKSVTVRPLWTDAYYIVRLGI